MTPPSRPPTAILYLSPASVGRLVRWPVLQRLSSAFNQSLKQRESQMLLCGRPAERQEMDGDDGHAGGRCLQEGHSSHLSDAQI